MPLWNRRDKWEIWKDLCSSVNLPCTPYSTSLSVDQSISLLWKCKKGNYDTEISMLWNQFLQLISSWTKTTSRVSRPYSCKGHWKSSWTLLQQEVYHTCLSSGYVTLCPSLRDLSASKYSYPSTGWFLVGNETSTRFSFRLVARLRGLCIWDHPFLVRSRPVSKVDSRDALYLLQDGTCRGIILGKCLEPRLKLRKRSAFMNGWMQQERVCTLRKEWVDFPSFSFRCAEEYSDISESRIHQKKNRVELLTKPLHTHKNTTLKTWMSAVDDGRDTIVWKQKKEETVHRYPIKRELSS